jgi:hypothetical protein
MSSPRIAAIVFFALSPFTIAPDLTAQADLVPPPSAPDIFRQALFRHRPVYKFDSSEDYFPVRVNAIANNPGNRLENVFGQTIAERHSNGTGLNIRYLRGGQYPNGVPVSPNDKLVERHGFFDPDGDYLEDARRLQANPALFNRTYGRVIPVRADGAVVGAWLQYWVFYYYNPFHKGPFGKHEGDWEMIQLRLDSLARPLFAVYAQHTGGSVCAWDAMERAGSNRQRPVVYVGGGSHASYFTAGGHDIEHVPGGDRADGNGWRDTTTKLRVVGNNSPRWLNWPGSWGATPGAFTSSPHGPKFQGKWSDPQGFLDDVGRNKACR